MINFARHFSACGIFFITAILLFAPGTGLGLDSPHNETNDYSCDSCHDVNSINFMLLPGWTPPSPLCVDDTLCNFLCWTCHNDDIAPRVKTHSSLQTSTRYGNWTVECWVCHTPHRQDQYRTYGSASYVYTGSSDGVTESTFVETGAGWEVDQFKGMLLIPNTENTNYNYTIVTNTSEQLTVNGPIDLTQVSAGDAFAITYGKLVRSMIDLEAITDPLNDKTDSSITSDDLVAVRYFGTTGQNSFADDDADGDGIRDGICEVCHTETTHFRNDGSGSDQTHGNVGGAAGKDCTGCHDHRDGFAHGGGPGAGCIECHGHDAGTVYGETATAPYVPNSGGVASMGVGTYQSHSTHTEIDPDDLKGPGIYCDDCHDINNFPFFKSGTDSNGDGIYNLDETDVCDACHSPGGTYDGLDDIAVGAKSNWYDSIYDHDGGNSFTLRAGKEKWCATCHDESPAQVSGINAPNVIGDESGAYTYGTGWGYYKTGHGLGSGVSYPSSGGMVPGAGKECSDCHDYALGHIDGLARTLDCDYYDDGDDTNDGCNSTEYRESYRLKLVDGANPMVIPRPVLSTDFIDASDFKLCFSSGCHSPDKFIDPAVLTTNFRDETDGDYYWGGTIPVNTHAYHLNGRWTSRYYPDWRVDTGVYGESLPSCVTCHNVHGSSQLSMVRDGNLNGKADGMTVYYNNGVEPVDQPSSTTLDDSTATAFFPPTSANLCESCHVQDRGGKWDRTPLAQEVPTLAWTGEIGYTADGVDPDSGPGGSPFVFRVQYTDASSEEPKYIQVWVDENDNSLYEDGEKHEMAAVDENDKDYTDGKLYRKTLSLRSGNHNYRFYARDAMYDAIDDPASPGNPLANSIVNVTSTAPTLTWTGEQGYATDGVNPNSGSSGTTFEFRVTFTDVNNDCPASGSSDIQVWIDEDDIPGDGSSYADPGERFNMSEVDAADTNCTDGKIYTLTRAISAAGDGTLSYRFHANDGTVDATGAATSTSTIIISSSNSAPVLTWTGDAGYTVDGVNPDSGAGCVDFKFRVEYTDADNNCPVSGSSNIQVWVDEDNNPGDGSSYADPGEMFNLIEADSGDTDCTDGKVYTLTKTIPYTGDGNIYYRFYASDGTIDATGTPTTGNTVAVSYTNGLKVPSDYATIQDAIDAAVDGDYVCVSDGTYSEQVNFINKAITVKSVNGPELTIIDGSGANAAVVVFNSGEGSGSMLDGFTVDNQVTDGVTRGIVIVDSSPTIRNSIIQGNVITSANSGGGIYIGGAGGGATIENTLIGGTVDPDTGDCVNGNTASSGGGVRYQDSVTGILTITDSTIQCNTGGWNGGGISLGNNVNTVVIDNTSINMNTAGIRYGGGIQAGTTPISFINSHVENNFSNWSGGGLYLNSCNVTFENSSLSGNTVGFGSGGGIYMLGSDSTLAFNNSTIADNNTNNTFSGGGLFLGGTSQTITIDNSTLSGNVGREGGAIYFGGSGSTLEIRDSEIISNIGFFGPGGLKAVGGAVTNVLTVDRTVIAGNHAPTVAGSGGGVCVASSDTNAISASFNSCMVTGNRSLINGGGFFVSGVGTTVDIINCTMSGNTARYGGAIYNVNAALTVNNSIMWGNKHKFFPEPTPELGDLYATATITNTNIRQSGYEGNGNMNVDPLFVDPRDYSLAPTAEGDYHLQPDSPVIDQGALTTHPGDDIDGQTRPLDDTFDMGADELTDGLFPLSLRVTKEADTNDGICDTDCSLREAVAAANAATTPVAISIPAGTYTITISGADEDANASGDFDVFQSTAFSGAGEGVTIIVGVSGDRVFHGVGTEDYLSFKNLTIQNGNHAGNGGCVYGSSSMLFDRVTFNNCDAQNGGAIFGDSTSTVSIKDSTFTNNDASNVGGAIRMYGGWITNSVFDINTASGTDTNDGGGAIFSSDNLLYIYGSTSFTNNSAVNRLGGAIMGEADLSIRGAIFDNNTASISGGAVYNGNGIGSYTTDVKTSVFTGNTSNDSGGAIFSQEDIIVTSSDFTGNSSNDSGGAIFSEQDVTITSSEFTGNTSTNSAGAIFSEQNVIVTSSDFTGNTSNNSAGAVFSQLDITMTTSTFADNISQQNRGGAVFTNGTAKADRSTFKNNIAYGDGGAVWGEGVALYNSTFSGNTSLEFNPPTTDSRGGAVFHNTFSNCIMKNATFYGNSAVDNADSLWSGGCMIRNTIFDNSSTTTADNNNNCNSSAFSKANSIENNISAIDSCGLGQTDPQLEALADNGGRTETHALLAGSAAIDIGDNAICADTDINNTDQRGQSRPADGDGDSTATCDIGAYEYIP